MGSGWSKPVDLILDAAEVIDRQRHLHMMPETGIYESRCCWYRKKNLLALKRSTKDSHIEDHSNRLYFEISLTKKLSSLPAEIGIRELCIYPAVTGINASPVTLELSMATQRIHGKTLISKGVKLREDIDLVKVQRELVPGQSFHFYDIPPPSLCRYVSLRVRFISPETTDLSTDAALRFPQNR